ncbi:MAG: NAD(P)/FAD-dependent oxidoreductase, partial [Nocardioides sp.]
MVSRSSYDVVVVGGGHNGLVSAAYLARAGLSTLVLERLDHTGGAAISAPAFTGRPTRLSRYSYLVSLMPEALMADLGLDVALRSRSTASYTPWLRDGRAGGLYVERVEREATGASFTELTGSDDDYRSWQSFYAEVGTLAQAVAPTLLTPLPAEQSIRDQVTSQIWDDIVTSPLGVAVERRFADDTVRGVVATDALIGTFASMHDESLIQNRCFLYHLIGNGTGEWRVPVGGMGAVTDALAKAAVQAGAEIITGAGVSAIRADAAGPGGEVTYDSASGRHTVTARYVLANVAPWVLKILLGGEADAATKPEGAQLKINVMLDRLPRLRSGVDPKLAFSGTLHLGED